MSRRCESRRHPYSQITDKIEESYITFGCEKGGFFESRLLHTHFCYMTECVLHYKMLCPKQNKKNNKTGNEQDCYL